LLAEKGSFFAEKFMNTTESPTSLIYLDGGVGPCSKLNHDRYHNGENGRQPTTDVLTDEALEQYQVTLVKVGGVPIEDAARAVMDIQRAYSEANRVSREIIASALNNACAGLMSVESSVRQSVQRESVPVQSQTREVVVFRKNR